MPACMHVLDLLAGALEETAPPRRDRVLPGVQAEVVLHGAELFPHLGHRVVILAKCLHENGHHYWKTSCIVLNYIVYII